MFKILEKRQKILLICLGIIFLLSVILLGKNFMITTLPKKSIEVAYISAALPQLISGIVVIMIGATMFLVGLVAWHMKLKDTFRFLYLAVSVGMMGSSFVLQSNLISSISSHPLFWENLEWISWVFSMILLFMYIMTFFQSGIRRVVTIVIDGVMIAVSVMIIFQKFSTIGQNGIFLVFIFGVACLYYESKTQETQEIKPILVPMYILILGNILEIINSFFSFTRIHPYFEIGFILFVLMMLKMMGLSIEGSIAKARKASELEAQLLQSKISVMLSQMKPHFLFNSLNAISGLCLTDPLKADEAIVKFSEYLRENINALECQTPIPFDKELHHIKNYVDVEKMRFEERLRVNYDIEFHDFEIPTLALQPIVENAIRHGIGKKSEGGTVTIKTSCVNNTVIVQVIDDGVGFDKQEAAKKEGSVGMTNAMERLKYMCNAQIEIDSIIGKGTTVKIWIPRKD